MQMFNVRTCRAKTVCRLWELKLKDFLPLAHHSPGAFESMVEQARSYTTAHAGDNAGLWERSLDEIKVRWLLYLLPHAHLNKSIL